MGMWDVCTDAKLNIGIYIYIIYIYIYLCLCISEYIIYKSIVCSKKTVPSPTVLHLCCQASIRLPCSVLTKDVIELIMVEKVMREIKATTTWKDAMTEHPSSSTVPWLRMSFKSDALSSTHFTSLSFLKPFLKVEYTWGFLWGQNKGFLAETGFWNPQPKFRRCLFKNRVFGPLPDGGCGMGGAALVPKPFWLYPS